MSARMRAEPVLSLTEPIGSLPEYLAAGGGQGLALARERGPERVIAQVWASGLRGRGGTGLSTARKWAAAQVANGQTRSLICNAADGELGTFKDRFILRRNPYQVVEGILIAVAALELSDAVVVIDESYQTEIAALREALDDMAVGGMLDGVVVQLAFGTGGCQHQVVTHNVETLANLPGILRRGAEWFRSAGTEASPGSMVFTVSGDVRLPGVYELPLGLPLNVLLDLVCAGAANGGHLKAVFAGGSAAPLPPSRFDTPLDFDGLRLVGSRLGTGGFIAYDDSACLVAVTRLLCSPGHPEVITLLEKIEYGFAELTDLRELRARCTQPGAEAAMVSGALDAFEDEFAAHLGRSCPLPRELRLPKLVDFDEQQNRFQYDARQFEPSQRCDKRLRMAR